jgi:hypothetical protein
MLLFLLLLLCCCCSAAALLLLLLLLLLLQVQAEVNPQWERVSAPSCPSQRCCCLCGVGLDASAVARPVSSSATGVGGARE